jgi:GT2 family glycosyltransferase
MITLQRLVLPQQGLCTEPDLFYRLAGGGLVRETAGEITVEPGGVLRFDTWFNALTLGVWRRAGPVAGLLLALRGRGVAEARVHLGLPGRSYERLACEAVELDPRRETLIGLDHAALYGGAGVLWCELHGARLAGSFVFAGGRFRAVAPAGEALRLAVCLHETGEAAPDKTGEATGAAAGAAMVQARRAHLAALLAAWRQEPDEPDEALPRPAGLFATPAAAAAFPGAVPVAGGGASGGAALAAAARAAGMTHALFLDPAAGHGTEVLRRAAAWLALGASGGAAGAVSGGAALTASPMHPAEGWRADWIASRAGGAAQGGAAQGGATQGGATQGGATQGGSAQGGAGRRLFRSADLRPLAALLEIEQAGIARAPGTIAAEPGLLAAALDAAGLAAALAPEAAAAAAPRLAVETLNGIMVAPPPAAAAATTLQHLIFPDPAISTEYATFVRFAGPGAYDAAAAEVVLEAGGTAFFDTYFNALSIGKWHPYCAPEGLALALVGRGRVEIEVFQAIPDRSWEVLASEIVTLSPLRETVFDLSHYARAATRGVIYFEARAAGGPAAITAGRYTTTSTPDPALRLALVITTFRREAEVEATVRRLLDWLGQAEVKDRLHLFVIDNGRSAAIPEDPAISYVPNANLGGAGGFARGLLEAQAAGFSHVLFMDDDATIPMENLHRTVTFLGLAREPRTAIAGAMINTTEKWRMWENGAEFDRRCRPLFCGLDLRSREDVLRLEFESARPPSDRLYGGWWYFAFPVAAVRHWPFPFFVRGDDVNFSLANDFRIVTLNGVVSFADDFFEKESPLTWYLDLRSHLVHHLSLPKMEAGRLALVKMAVWFCLRNVPKFQYETIAAVLLAWADVLRGPGFFAASPDAGAARAAIKALTRDEAWKPLAAVETGERRRFRADAGWRHRLWKYTLNGHLLPFAGFFGNRIVLPVTERNHYAAIWGASRITVFNASRDKAYMTRRSRRRLALLMLRMLALAVRFVIRYAALRRVYRAGHAELTTPAWWRGALGLPAAAGGAAEPQTPAAPAAPRAAG